MKRTFEKLLEHYVTLLEAPIPEAPAGPDASGANPMDATPQAQLAQPTQKLQSSVGYAVLAQVVLDALRAPPVRDLTAIKYSDNTVRTPEEAYRYLEIIKKFLPRDSQQKLTGDMGKGATVDLDSSELVYLVQLGLKALFYNGKNQPASEQETPINDLKSIVKVNTDNAKEAMEKVRNLLSNTFEK